ncbi:class I SAM-dependent methyltransferase [Desulfocurvus vexinensis]|uniref:class I SAM-dependent methyltransferase n=1 Tax=Desulfocurvus vexinensis TaxID=399548 RepID=UPI00146F9492|nr:class I SAM-dependent methyltransferase [Desulfocurvus vexinensis]
MGYDDTYQNEQGHSPVFQHHLEEALDIIRSIADPGGRIVEIGCGKGVFLSMLRAAGFDVTGYDPAHEAGDPDVIKEYFDDNLAVVPGDIIVLRHTLEHVPNPLSFLNLIKKANAGQGKILIEVPGLEWIVDKKAFWDIFHEHCNYFSAQTLKAIFSRATVHRCFGGQYIWLVAELADLQDIARPSTEPVDMIDETLFQKEIDRLRELVTCRPDCLIWGAGAKGVAFANLVDPDARIIRGIIDINPKKQWRYIAKSGHSIYPPNELHNLGAGDIIVMNENYRDEIATLCEGYPNTILTIGKI